MNSSNGVDGRGSWAINGRYLTQRMTGVQRYAHEIIASLDEISSEHSDIARRLGIRLVLPPGAQAKSAFSQIEICRTEFGSGHAWDQFVLPWYATSGVLSLGNSGPIFARNHIVCIHDANTFIEQESHSRAFGMAYRTLLPLIGKRATKVATLSGFSADMLVEHAYQEMKAFARQWPLKGEARSCTSTKSCVSASSPSGQAGSARGSDCMIGA
jgi:hypothetical protein